MMRPIDYLLNRVTMYRLALYYLIGLLVVAYVYSAQGALSFSSYALLFSTAFLLAACVLTNWIFSRTFGVPANSESTFITALILALIITPLQSFNDLWFLLWAAVWSMGSKYIVAIRGKHLFNPAAFAVALTYFTINQSASWWVGDAHMLPFVLVGGLLVVRKLRRFDMVLSFLLTALVTTLVAALISSLVNGSNVIAAMQRVVLYSPLLFFAFIMLTEPLTSPPTRRLRIYYGALVGFLFTPAFHIGSFFTTPELALLIGNLYSYLVSPKAKLVLRLKEKAQIAPDIYEFTFAPNRRLAFAPGQYMEWTLGHPDTDSRGNRRYFTLASAPTEGDLKLGVRFYPRSSSFKKALLHLEGDHEVIAGQLAGDFTLPEDPRQKCVFIAGGIGITPFRSMLQYLLDTRQRRPIAVFYLNHSIDDVVYKDVLDRAERELGIKTIYVVSDRRNLPPRWVGHIGRITPEWMRKMVPGYKNCLFYVSGSIEMINSVKDALKKMGVKESQIKTDFFQGLA